MFLQARLCACTVQKWMLESCHYLTNFQEAEVDEREKPNNTSQYRGVTRHKRSGRWEVSLTLTLTHMVLKKSNPCVTTVQSSLLDGSGWIELMSILALLLILLSLLQVHIWIEYLKTQIYLDETSFGVLWLITYACRRTSGSRT